VFSAFAIVYGTADSYVYLIPASVFCNLGRHWVGWLDEGCSTALRVVLGARLGLYCLSVSICHRTKPQVDASRIQG